MKTLNFAVITVSDRSSQGERPDASGPLIQEYIKTQGQQVEYSSIIPDEMFQICNELKKCADIPSIDIILTSGGTGISDRDVTPEATIEVSEKLIPGIPEYIRMKSFQITPNAMLSRGVAGVIQNKLIINLPGSPKGSIESLSFVFPILNHAVAQLRNLPSAQDHDHIVAQ